MNTYTLSARPSLVPHYGGAVGLRSGRKALVSERYIRKHIAPVELHVAFRPRVATDLTTLEKGLHREEYAQPYKESKWSE